MSQYYMLIKNRFIDFDKMMIDKYHLLNLNETDAIILIKLNSLLNQGKIKLSSDLLAPTMSITANTISKRIVDLVKEGFITLTLADKDASEIFSLDETYKRLGSLLENEDQTMQTKQITNHAKEIVSYLEKEFAKMVTPLELEMIQRWVVEDQFPLEQIKDAINECKRLKKYNVKYVDVFLNKKPQSQSKPQENLQELFNNVYQKIRK